jgi:hypothetical protein
MIKIHINGLERVVSRLGRMESGMKPMMQEAMKKAVLYVHSQVPPYPAASGASNYRRTGLLGRSVTTLMGAGPEALSRVEALGGQVKGIVGTAVQYAPFVIDKRRQAGQHRGRWWNLQDVVINARDGIRKIFEGALHRLVGG